MNRRRNGSTSGAMLDLWRPPHGAGDPVGCLASTYTFAPGLFDEQCLARFLEIESEPDREDLAFLLERETRLGGIFAGVLVDRSQSGVEHSLRWDVLPVRVPAGKQHAKLSLLAWTRHVRIVVSSANLTEPGYRSNREVAATIESTPDDARADLLTEAIDFLRSLLRLVPGVSDAEPPPECRRAAKFLDEVERQLRAWQTVSARTLLRQHLVCTLPPVSKDEAPRSSLEEAIQLCRGRGGSPSEAWIASPFYDVEDSRSLVTASMCKLMARGVRRRLSIAVPAATGDGGESYRLRLAAPKALLRTPAAYNATVGFEILPTRDEDKNPRPWHAKMLALHGEAYLALMIGSSNFTSAGMGIAHARNAEANLLTLVDRVAYGREGGQLEAVWPEMEQVVDAEGAEWLGPSADQEEERATALAPPAGFLSATYRAGDERRIILRFDPAHLPADWSVHACGQNGKEMLSSSAWQASGQPQTAELPWPIPQPPAKLLIRWDTHETFLPLNVEDSRCLPPPAQLEHMSADDMLGVLAAADPSAAFRAWHRRQHSADDGDSELDSPMPIDLDPLRRYDLEATFLHRVGRRARILAQLRANLQRAVWGRQALEWRLHGLVGIQALADRLVREFEQAGAGSDEALLALADFLIVLHEVDYQPTEGSLPKAEFDAVFSGFLVGLADQLQQRVEACREGLSTDVIQFWERVIQRCRI